MLLQEKMSILLEKNLSTRPYTLVLLLQQKLPIALTNKETLLLSKLETQLP